MRKTRTIALVAAALLMLLGSTSVAGASAQELRGDREAKGESENARKRNQNRPSFKPVCLNTALNVHVFLQGSEQPGVLMRTDLNGLIDPVDPYGLSPDTDPTILDQVGAVDWIQVDVVDPQSTDGDAFARVSGLLLADGKIVNHLGLPLFVDVPDNGPNGYRINVYHRNHVGVQSAVIGRSFNSLSFDFRYSTYVPQYGDHQAPMDFGLAMFAGNGNQNGVQAKKIVDATDVARWQLDNGLYSVYLETDYNMDGDVNGADKILAVNNNGNQNIFPMFGSFVGC